MMSNSFGQTFLWSIIFSVWGAYVGRTNSHKSLNKETFENNSDTKNNEKPINLNDDFRKSANS